MPQPIEVHVCMADIPQYESIWHLMLHLYLYGVTGVVVVIYAAKYLDSVAEQHCFRLVVLAIGHLMLTVPFPIVHLHKFKLVLLDQVLVVIVFGDLLDQLVDLFNSLLIWLNLHDALVWLEHVLAFERLLSFAQTATGCSKGSHLSGDQRLGKTTLYHVYCYFFRKMGSTLIL